MKPSDKACWAGWVWAGVSLVALITVAALFTWEWLFALPLWFIVGCMVMSGIDGSTNSGYGVLYARDAAWVEKGREAAQEQKRLDRCHGLDQETWKLLSENDRAWLEGARAEAQIDPLEEAMEEVRLAAQLQETSLYDVQEAVPTHRATRDDVQEVSWDQHVETTAKYVTFGYEKCHGCSAYEERHGLYKHKGYPYCASCFIGVLDRLHNYG